MGRGGEGMGRGGEGRGGEVKQWGVNATHNAHTCSHVHIRTYSNTVCKQVCTIRTHTRMCSHTTTHQCSSKFYLGEGRVSPVMNDCVK